MKTITIAVFCLISISSSTLLAQEIKPKLVLSSKMRKVIAGSKTVLAAHLPYMLHTPRLILPNEPGSPVKALSAAQQKTVIKHLIESVELEDMERFNHCKYEPGMKLTFYSKELSKTELYGIFSDPKAESNSVLLCFNCNVWAFADYSNSHYMGKADRAKVKYFGDSKPSRKELLELFNQLFPSHKIKK
jgi:hypothetical protein